MIVKSEVKTAVSSEVEFWKCNHVTEGGLLFGIALSFSCDL